MVAEVLNGQKFDEIWVLSGLSGCDVIWVTDLYPKTSPENRSCFSCAGHSILGQLGLGWSSYALDGTFKTRVLCHGRYGEPMRVCLKIRRSPNSSRNGWFTSFEGAPDFETYAHMFTVFESVMLWGREASWFKLRRMAWRATVEESCVVFYSWGCQKATRGHLHRMLEYATLDNSDN